MSIQQSAPPQAVATSSRPEAPLLEGHAGDEEEVPSKPAPPPEPVSVRSEASAMFHMGWPMVVSFACRLSMASTDTFFVGHLDNSTIGPLLEKSYDAESYLAAATLADMVVSVFTTPPLAFNQVLNALVGQALGSGNKKMAGTWLQLSVFFCSFSYLPFLACSFFLTGPTLHLFGFPEDVCELANVFAKISCIWPIPNAIYQCMRFYFQAQGISRPAMYNNLVFVLVNVFLNWLFVFGGPFQYLPEGSAMHWHGVGFIGSPMSISASRLLQPFFYAIYMFGCKRAHAETWPGCNLDFLRCVRVKKFCGQALPYVGTLIFQAVSGQATTLMIAQLGSLAIATSSASAAISQIATQGFAVAFTQVAAVRVGFHLGRGDGEAAKLAMGVVLVGSTLVSVVALFICWPAAEPISSLATTSEDVIHATAMMMASVFVGAGLSQVVGILTGGVLGGMGRTFIITLISFGFELPASIGGVAVMVFVLKWRMPYGLMDINWGLAAINVFELLVVGGIILCTDWAKCAREARDRQEAEEAEEAAAAPATVSPLEAAPEATAPPALGYSEERRAE